ncbi:SET domain-containing protein 9 [Mactra antiquata]
MIKSLARRWNQYKYRFVPWLAANINESSPRIVETVQLDKLISDEDVEQQLNILFSKFGSNHDVNSQAVLDLCGFRINRKPSLLEDGGIGVFVDAGLVKSGTVVAIYPGAVYQPWEPVFLISLRNSYLFRCADSVHIDGKDKGLSRMMYNSFARRDSLRGQLMCDNSWQTEYPLNPLAVGQYVNNQSNKFSANVAYQEFDVPAKFPSHLRKYIPNTEARLHQDMEQSMFNRLLRMVVLVSIRDIHPGEELFSTYFTIVSKPS